MATATQMITVVGREALIRFEGIDVRCQIVDAKQSYGKYRLLVEPIHGHGQQWIEAPRISSVIGAKFAQTTFRELA